ncbi:hypothetical protein, partial [Calothrix rhizosoleniae]|uniref:hypothetical protein n=1 Tax=Calothrix rhizosoleniae TaxID=888997 RepID=UPI00135659D5
KNALKLKAVDDVSIPFPGFINKKGAEIFKVASVRNVSIPFPGFINKKVCHLELNNRGISTTDFDGEIKKPDFSHWQKGKNQSTKS